MFGQVLGNRYGTRLAFFFNSNHCFGCPIFWISCFFWNYKRIENISLVDMLFHEGTRQLLLTSAMHLSIIWLNIYGFQVFRGQTARLGQDQNHRLLESACRRGRRRWSGQEPLGGRSAPPPPLLRQHHCGRRQQPEGGEQSGVVGPGHPQQHVRDGQHVPPSCRTDQVVMGFFLLSSW